MPTTKTVVKSNISQSETPVLSKSVSLVSKLAAVFKARKKLVIGLCLVLLVLFGYGRISAQKNTKEDTTVKSVVTQIDKSFDFAALNGGGKPTKEKIKLKFASGEKTNQVQVKDQVYTAKNNKLFLIVNLELKNDTTAALNLLPGDLIRLTVSGNEDSKFAPDLHNNLVLVAPISTKTDRIGFVIPQEAKEFKLYVGELEGKKEVINITFPS